jgi:hypothetical protein
MADVGVARQTPGQRVFPRPCSEDQHLHGER